MKLNELAALRFTYAEVGATVGPLPQGYGHLDASAVIGHGRQRFEEAAASVMRAIEATTHAGTLTPDLGGQATTTQVTDAVLAALEPADWVAVPARPRSAARNRIAD